MPKKSISKNVKETKQVNKPVSKKVTFTKTPEPTEKNDNIFLDTPVKENYPITGDLNLDEDELAKETEIENEDTEANEKDETEKEESDKEESDEDHELDDEVEYEEENVNDLDDLYDDADNINVSKKKKKKKNNDGQDDDDEFDKLEKELCEYDYGEIYDEKKENPVVIVEDSNRITYPRLTKYEKVRLIATRAKQISLGAKVMIKNMKPLAEELKKEFTEKHI